MFYIVVPELKKVLAWSNKCGGSSMRRQLIYDLKEQDLIDQMHGGANVHNIVAQRFTINPGTNNIPAEYEFMWYVRDPFYRTLSCFINRKIIVEGGDPDVTFRDFVFNLEHFRANSSNIKSHTEPQIRNYFEAPWNIIDIKNAKFPDVNHKANSTKYTLGDKLNAWNIPAKDLVVNNQTYSSTSFYSPEVADAIKSFYKDDYEFLKDKVHLI